MTDLTSTLQVMEVFWTEREVETVKKTVVMTEAGEKEIRDTVILKPVKEMMVRYKPNPFASHGKTEVVQRVIDLRPGQLAEDPTSQLGMQAHVRWDRIRPHVEAFERGEKMAGIVTGTPIEDLRVLTEVHIHTLKRWGYYTLESIRDAQINELMTCGLPNMRRIQAQAASHLAQLEANTIAKASHAGNDDLRAEVDDLRAQNQAMMEAMTEMMAQLKAGRSAEAATSDDDADDRPRRGRKPMPRDAEGNIVRETAEAA